MYERLTTKAFSLNDVVEWLGKEICLRHNLDEPDHLKKLHSVSNLLLIKVSYYFYVFIYSNLKAFSFCASWVLLSIPFLFSMPGKICWYWACLL